MLEPVRSELCHGSVVAKLYTLAIFSGLDGALFYFEGGS